MATIQFPKEAELGKEETSDVTTVKVWGCRGSIPRSEPNMIKYGGSTSCVEFLSSSGTRVVLDMGSGSYALGQHMIGQYFGGGPDGKARNSGGNIFITHTQHFGEYRGCPHALWDDGLFDMAWITAKRRGQVLRIFVSGKSPPYSPALPCHGGVCVSAGRDQARLPPAAGELPAGQEMRARNAG